MKWKLPGIMEYADEPLPGEEAPGKKKRSKMGLNAVLILALIGLIALLAEPVLDALPIDQSRWQRAWGKTYYYSQKGDKVTGWLELDGNRYYLDPEAKGAMRTGWLELDGDVYYLDSDGKALTGWQQIDDRRYYLESTGKVHTGWLEDQGHWYCLDTDGSVLTGWQTLEGQRRYLKADGTAATGWTALDDGRYCFGPDGTALTGWIGTGSGRCYLDESGRLCTGWLELDGDTYYLDENGCISTGMVEADGKTYYLDDAGHPCTGWQTIDGKTRYFDPESYAMAKGQVTIDGKTCYFTSTGAEILLVNPFNPLPDDYRVNLVYSADGRVVSEECSDALYQMLAGCRAAGYSARACSGYRARSVQQRLFDRQVGIWLASSSSYEEAYAAAAQVVAVPGTSEHQTGLAVDIVDASYGLLNEHQAQTPAQQWLMENSWRYGFILRYPTGTTEWTGIIYEPWHYRYVGKELAQELYELDMCLEEYLAKLTDNEL